MSGAALNRGASRSDWGTPPEFLRAVRNKFGPLAFDLAARADNAVCPKFFTPEQDSLKQDWGALEGRLWLNPPYDNIAPWAQKAAQSFAPVLMLVPASIGSNWYRDCCYPFATTYALNGRIKFVGAKDPYPKDCMLLNFGGEGGELFVWNWKESDPL